MVLDTVLVGVTAEFLVDSINGMVTANPSLSREWVGLILLPIVGNAAEHFTAVSVSVKDKLDLSISVAVGSSIQISLFVIPVIVLLAWCIGKPLTLLFDPYESIVLFLSVIVVNQTLSDGRSNWMEGLVLMFLYLIIAVSFWYYPVSLGLATAVSWERLMGYRGQRWRSLLGVRRRRSSGEARAPRFGSCFNIVLPSCIIRIAAYHFDEIEHTLLLRCTRHCGFVKSGFRGDSLV